MSSTIIIRTVKMTKLKALNLKIPQRGPLLNVKYLTLNIRVGKVGTQISEAIS